MSNTSIRFFHSTMPGAPILSGTVGALKQVLDACLVDGFGLSPVGTLTVSDGIATLTWGTAHGFPLHAIVRIQGATSHDLNGDKRVIFSSTNTIRFAADGVPDGTYGSSVTAKIAPAAGWSKPHDDINRAVYKSQHVLATQHVLAVDDTTTTHATMTAADAALGVGDLVTPWATRFWFKSSDADTSPVEWSLVCDSRTIYMAISAGQNWGVYGFGDYESFIPNDPFAAFLSGYSVPTLNSPSNRHSRSLNIMVSAASADNQLILSSNSTRSVRGSTAALSPAGLAKADFYGDLTFVSGGRAYADTYYYSVADGFSLTTGLSGFNSTIVLAKPLVRQTQGELLLMGTMRGLHHVLGDITTTVPGGSVFSSRDGNHLVVFISSFAKGNTSDESTLEVATSHLAQSRIAFPISGEW